MFISINRTNTDGNKQFKVSIDGKVSYYGCVSYASLQSLSDSSNVVKSILTNLDDKILYSTNLKVIKNNTKSYMPFKSIFNKKQTASRLSILNESNEYCGSLYTKVDGFLDSKFNFTFNNEVFIGYDVSIGNIRTISIYNDNFQIAQITKPLNVANHLDYYYIHLLDNYSYMKEGISLFAINLVFFENDENYNNSQVKDEVRFCYTYSKSNKFYNQFWIRERFGQAEYNRFYNLLKWQDDTAKAQFKSTSSKILKLNAFIVFVCMLFIFFMWILLIL